MVGGIPWQAQSNGTFFLNCLEGPNNGQFASPLDKYMMGLIPASSVAPLYAPTNGEQCYDYASNYLTVTIESIQAMHGVRTPTPESARKSFNLGFVAESYGRWLTPAELTFYDILAGHFTKPIPPEEDAPRVNGWVSIDRYFGEGSTWSSDVLGVIRPRIQGITPLPTGGAQVSGVGYPGRNYRLLRATNIVGSWVVVTNGMAATNGAFTLRDSQTTLPAPRFYRVTTP
jgi:hypothetical protein